MPAKGQTVATEDGRPCGLAVTSGWASGNVKLYLGDCMDILPTLAGIDAVISDPPYGMDWNTDSTRFSGGQVPTDRTRRLARGIIDGRDDWGAIAADDHPFDPAPWMQYPRCVLFGANHYAARLPVGTLLIWLKKDDHLFGTFLSDAEVAWMKGGHGVYAYRQTFTARTKAKQAHGTAGYDLQPAHPTQKPVELMAWCMDRAKVPPGATVLDPYMGSGSTGIACIRTGRGFVGIEKDPSHYATALERIQRELSQGDLFLGSPNTAYAAPSCISNPPSSAPPAP